MANLSIQEYIKCVNENEKIQQWFDAHKEEVRVYLLENHQDVEEIILMGSRKWLLMHTASDIDASIIVHSQQTDKIMELLKLFYKHNSHTTFKTKMGLDLFRVNDFYIDAIDRNKTLEYVIQTSTENKSLIDETEQLINKNYFTLESKAEYSQSMFKAKKENNQQEIRRLKNTLNLKDEKIK